MKHILSSLKAFLLALTAFIGLTACDVHEEPHIDYGDIDYYLDLVYEGDMPLYQEILFSRSYDNESRASFFAHDVRYIIKVYPAGANTKSRFDDTPLRTFVFTDRSDAAMDRRLKISLPEGDWDIYAWTDFVDLGKTDDKYYILDDWSAISLPSPSVYEGSNECRQTFRGMTRVNVVHPYRFMENETLPDYCATVDMVRPTAKFEFVSTDVEEFVKRLPDLTGRGSRKDNESRGEIDSRSLSRADLEDFKVVFRYTAFNPSVYNIFTDKPTDSRTGMSFESFMDVRDDGIVLGFDHVLVNSSETIVNVSCEVYNSDGDKIASSPSIEVPVLRGKYTTVKSEFLTSSSQGGVSINPGFDGDYDIEIK